MTLPALIVALLSVAGFGLALWALRVIPYARRLSGVAVEGVSAMLDSALEDDAKERAVRRAGLRLIGGAFGVTWRFGVALAATALPIFLADRLGLVPEAQSLGLLMRVDFLIGVSVLALAVLWLLRRGKQRPEGAAGQSYGSADRLSHAIAFSGPGMLRAAARLDDWLHRKHIAQAPAPRPIFVTSLARGGTTALLNALEPLPGVATHRYRDMPFIAAPLLWARISGRSRSVATRERAHGDGMAISLDSPEAFDEIFWRLNWPGHYQPDLIDLWKPSDQTPEAQGFFSRHFRKIALLRRPGVPGARYLSKNNANLARLDLLPEMFPGCDIVVPLRRPAAHAASLLRQHRNFAKIHAEDGFVLRYMRDIGHLEFGALQRPIGFDMEALSGRDPETADYWLAYWIAAFEHVLAHTEGLHLITQDDMRLAPQATVTALAKRLGLELPKGTDFAHHFRPGEDPQPIDMFDPMLLTRAQALYDRLAALSVRAGEVDPGSGAFETVR